MDGKVGGGEGGLQEEREKLTQTNPFLSSSDFQISL